MKLSIEMKTVVVTEIKYVVKMMRETNNLREKTYFFSAVYGAVNRVMNIEYLIPGENKWTLGSYRLGDIQLALEARSYSRAEVREMFGQCNNAPWKLVQRPFDVEYPPTWRSRTGSSFSPCSWSRVSRSRA